MKQWVFLKVGHSVASLRDGIGLGLNRKGSGFVVDKKRESGLF